MNLRLGVIGCGWIAGRHARAAVHVEANVAVADPGAAAGEDAHADADLSPAGPAVLGERALRPCGRTDGVAGSGEGDEEGIALRVDFVASRLGDRLAQQPVVVGQHLGVTRLSELVQEPRRALDVGEEKGDGSARGGDGHVHRRVPRARRGPAGVATAAARERLAAS